MERFIERSARLTVLVRSALGLLLALVVLLALSNGSISAAVPASGVGNPVPENAVSSAADWKAVRPHHARSARSQNFAAPFPSRSNAGKLTVTPATLVVDGCFLAELLPRRRISGSRSYLGLRTRNPRDPPAIAAPRELA